MFLWRGIRCFRVRIRWRRFECLRLLLF